jgi:hypothetical protein
MGFSICPGLGERNRWPNGIVPFEIDDVDFPPSSSSRQKIIEAIDMWNFNTCIRFVPRTDQADFVKFQKDTSPTPMCNSPVGRRGTGEQKILCALDSSGFGTGTIVHEIGHTLGLFHEHQRPDRDRFVNILEGNIDLGPDRLEVNFGIRESDCPVGSYDCGSIMHYDKNAFGKEDGGVVRETIQIVDTANCPSIGNRTMLSSRDIQTIDAIYGFPTLGIEGLSESDKITLDERSDSAPSLAFHQGRLFIAWRGRPNEKINILFSENGGASFRLDRKFVFGETTTEPPILASHQQDLFVAWKGSGNEDLNVAKVVFDPNDNSRVTGFANKITLNERSDSAPSLASHRGRLFIAWRGRPNEEINILFSEDGGANFRLDRKFVSGETTTATPFLTSHDGRLFVTWKGSGNEDLNIAEVVFDPIDSSRITGFANKTTLDERSDSAPFLASHQDRLFIAWRGRPNEQLNLINACGRLGIFAARDGFKQVSDETSSDTPFLASGGGRLFIAWKGSGNENLNVTKIDLFRSSFQPLVQFDGSLNTGLINLSQGINALLIRRQFTNAALVALIANDRTMIRELDRSAGRACDLLAEARAKTALQRDLARDTARLLEIARTVHPEAELEMSRSDKLVQKIEKCCPPESEPPFCRSEQGSLPPDFREQPPAIDYKPLPEITTRDRAES